MLWNTTVKEANVVALCQASESIQQTCFARYRRHCEQGNKHKADELESTISILEAKLAEAEKERDAAKTNMARVVNESVEKINAIIYALDPTHTAQVSIWHGLIVATEVAAICSIERRTAEAQNKKLREALGHLIDCAVGMPFCHDNLCQGTLDHAIEEARQTLEDSGNG